MARSTFQSKLGQLAGNHFATMTGDRDELLSKLKDMGRRVLWQGAQDIVIEEVA